MKDFTCGVHTLHPTPLTPPISPFLHFSPRGASITSHYSNNNACFSPAPYYLLSQILFLFSHAHLYQWSYPSIWQILMTLLTTLFAPVMQICTKFMTKFTPLSQWYQVIKRASAWKRMLLASFLSNLLGTNENISPSIITTLGIWHLWLTAGTMSYLLCDKAIRLPELCHEMVINQTLHLLIDNNFHLEIIPQTIVFTPSQFMFKLCSFHPYFKSFDMWNDLGFF